MRLDDLKSADATYRDHLVNARYFAQQTAGMVRFSLRQGPVFVAREVRRLPWLRYLLKANRILDMATRTRTGPYREANAMAMSAVVRGIAHMVEDMYDMPDRLVMNEDLIPPEILYGMGLTNWMVELLGIAMPLIQEDFAEPYIDAAENEGIPPDVCSLPKSTMGMFLEGHMPQPAAVITSNLPCDGGMSSYSLIERVTGAPTLRLDVPFNFYSERAVEYFTSELERAIVWLEEHTPGRMDWDRLREVCEERNRATEYEMELWDMMRERPAPMAGEAVYLSHLVHMIARPGRPLGTRVYKDLVRITKKIRARGQGALEDERYRVVLWNPPTLIYPDLFVWAEQNYGVALIMDMLSYNRHPYIDTGTPRSMLKSLARIIMEGPMARHTRGPAENFFGDLFHLYEHFSLDMIWMAGHIGCKNTMALSGMFREKCRERGIPLLNISYDLSDTRVVSPLDMRKQSEEFLENIMHAERLL
ncbi:MAG: 2-hydroxyacyl-CoA dehydratase subunit D [Desulfatibacillaceae bacterium]